MTIRRCRRFGFTLALVIAATAPGLAQRAAKAPPAPANEVCLACHGDPSATAPDGRSIGVDPAKFGASMHGALGMACVACHTDLEKTRDFPHPERLAKVVCAGCHAAAAAAYDKSIHAAARRGSPTSVAPACSDCHTSHEIRSAKDPESGTYPLRLPATCGRCHGDANIIKQGNIRIGNVLALYDDSIHGHAISKDGLLVAANCTSCHGNHDIRKKTDPESPIARANVPATCGSCHEGVKALYDKGAHGTAFAKGDPKAPVCTDCHTAHHIQRADQVAWRLDVIRECGTCHIDKIKTYRDTFHGQVTSLGFVRTAACSDCHGPHAVFPKTDPRSTVSEAQVLHTCQTCHPTATKGFAQYDPHADKIDRARNPALFYTAVFMRWLLGGVFLFFGAHTLFWLPRSIRERKRAASSRRVPDATESEK